MHILRRAVSGGEKGQATMSCIWGSNVIHIKKSMTSVNGKARAVVEGEHDKSWNDHGYT